MQTVFAEAFAAILLMAALHRRPGVPALALAASFIAGMVMSQYRHGDALRPILIAFDAAIVATMWFTARRYGLQRAQVIGSLSMLRIAIAVVSAVSHGSWTAYALVCNIAFFIQIMVAGGMADGFLAWLGHRLWGIRDRGVVLFGANPR